MQTRPSTSIFNVLYYPISQTTLPQTILLIMQIKQSCNVADICEYLLQWSEEEINKSFTIHSQNDKKAEHISSLAYTSLLTIQSIQTNIWYGIFIKIQESPTGVNTNIQNPSKKIMVSQELKKKSAISQNEKIYHCPHYLINISRAK